jgi:hypothetical protein
VTSGPYPARNPLGSVRPSSARALLLVMIGEFVWPAGQPAWSSTLLSGLSEFDIEPNAARKALHRIAATGVTESRREGNRVRWSVTPKDDGILRAGWERTYGWHARDTEWDGRWLVLSVTVPESQRKLRHHLQNRLLWAGLGSPAPTARTPISPSPRPGISMTWARTTGPSSTRTPGGSRGRTCRPPTCRRRGRRPRRHGCSPSGIATGRSGQLQGQRNAVQPTAELGHRGGVVRGHDEIRAYLPGAGDQ